MSARHPPCALARSLLVALLLSVAAGPAAVHAQTPPPERPPPPGEWTAPVWTGDVAFLAANSLIGGLTAGLVQELRGGSFRDGFTRGTLGGAIAYAGRRVAVERFYGAGLLGRQVGAVGASVVRNASEARPGLERIMLPIGPVHLYVDRSDGTGLTARVSAYDLFWVGRAVFTPELELDAAESVSAGAPVFRAPRRRIVLGTQQLNGMVAGGTILVSGSGVPDPAAVLAHERAHVLQLDFVSHAWNGPAERWLLERIPFGPDLQRFVDLDIAAGAVGFGLSWVFDIDYENRPWELEATFLERR